MTMRFFDDLCISSPDGRLRLEAVSPDNRKEAGTNFGFQNGFVYRLADRNRRSVLWERTQPSDEGSPLSAFVSDHGYVVVRTSGTSWASDRLLFFTPTGKLGLEVDVSAADTDSDDRRGPTADRRISPGSRPALWIDEHVQLTTAGPRWTGGSLATFASEGERSFFSLRTAWGRRLVVDLGNMCLQEDIPVAPTWLACVEAVERVRALALLRRAASDEASEPESDGTDTVGAAIGVAMAQRLIEATPCLRTIEQRWKASTTVTSHVLGSAWTIEEHRTRALARLALRSFGEVPVPGGNYTVVSEYLSADPQAPTPMASSDGSWARARTTPARTTGRELLASAGPPDCIHSGPRKVGEHTYVWPEAWDYDGPETTTRVVWTCPDGTNHKRFNRPRRVERVEEQPAGWRDPERLLSLLL